MDIKARYVESLAEARMHLGTPAHARLPIDGTTRAKNIRLFDWYEMDEDDKAAFYDVFGDIETDNALGEYLVDRGGDQVFCPELRDEVVPFAHIIGGSACFDDCQNEGLLMLDLRPLTPTVLMADIDGTIDGSVPFHIIEGGVRALAITAGATNPYEE